MKINKFIFVVAQHLCKILNGGTGNMKFLKYSLTILLVFLLAIGLAACDTDGDDSQVPTDTDTNVCAHETMTAVAETEATCTSEGQQAHFKCDGCGKLFEDKKGNKEITDALSLVIPKTDHVFADCWKSDGQGHWQECECTAKTAYATHTFKWVTDVEPTLTTTGLEHQECEACGYRTSENTVIPKLDHVHTLQYIPAVAATCATDGNLPHYHCTDCFRNYADEDAEIRLTKVSTTRLGHMFLSYSFNHDATCAEDGTETAVCRRAGCNATDQRIVADSKLGHLFAQYVPLNEATCTEDATEIAVCQRADCRAEDIRTVANSKLGHAFVNYVSDENATCTEDGTETAVCERAGCGVTDTRTEADSRLGHAFVNYVSDENATCTEDGTETAVCERDGCNETDTRTVVGSKLNHLFEVYGSDGNATCTEDGTETAMCARDGCNVEDTRTVVGSKLGHQYVNRICARCGDVEEVADPTAPWTVQLTWNVGYVGSSTNPYGYANKICATPGDYVYTDVFTIPKAGTTITFCDDNISNNSYATDNCYIFSSWKQVDGAWVIDVDGANYAGSGIVSDIVISKSATQLTYAYTTAKDNEHLRLCYKVGKNVSDRAEVTAAEVGNTPTVQIKQQLEQWIEDSRQDYYPDNLKGLTINAIGDSYFQGAGLDPDYIWLSMLAEKYGIDMTNHGIGGSTVSNYVTNHNPMVDRFYKMPDNAPDIFLLEGGKNDYNVNAPLGDVNSRDTKTFMGALNVLIDAIQEKYPNAMIVCFPTWNFPQTNQLGLKYPDYCNAMHAVAIAQGVYFVRSYDPAVSGVNMSDKDFVHQYCLHDTDISHLNREGMKNLLLKYERILSELYADFKANPPAPSTTETVANVAWNTGYVGSSTNGEGYVNQIRPGSAVYAYTDVFTVPKAGTAVTFVDDNANTTEIQYASAAAYVVSLWKLENGEWVLDADATHYPGSGSKLSDILVSYENGVVTYTYITQKDNENLRLCFRTGAVLPAYPTVYLTELSEWEVKTKWHLGYVGSSTNAGNTDKLADGASLYSYTDVITVSKAGTTITFVDDNTNANGDKLFASAAAYVVSFWNKEEDNWVLDTTATNYAGSNSALSDILVSYENGVVTYSYTTKQDNENLRLCFRSGQTAAFTPAAYPTITAYTPAS